MYVGGSLLDREKNLMSYPVANYLGERAARFKGRCARLENSFSPVLFM